MLNWFNKIKKLFFRRKMSLPSINFMEFEQENNMAWWGAFIIENEQSRYLKIGNVVICVDRYNQDWTLTTYQEGEAKKTSKNTGIHIVKGDLTLRPVLPDRPVLFQLDALLLLSPKEEITLYASTPIYVRVDIGTQNIVLHETPTVILSDTWSGKNTRDGDLCFAADSYAVLGLENVLRDNTHAITVVTLSNQSNTELFISEIKIPAPFLSVFVDGQNHLWTEQLNVSFDVDGSTDTLITRNPVKTLKDVQKLSMPRLTVKSGLKGLFSPKTLARV